MTYGHKDGRRPARRAFKPTLEGRLETRELLSGMTAIRSQTAAGGQAVVITNTVGQQFFVSVTQGAVQASPAAGGRVNLIVEGSTVDTDLEINQIIPAHPQTKGAHTFNKAFANQNGLLNIASIAVTSGTIHAIEGYRTAVLSGPIILTGTNTVDRIAFQSILPGGTISVGGDLNTLDILGNADFSQSAGLFVGQDLNWFDLGGSLTVEKGSNVVIGRDLGPLAQPAKGTGLAGQGLFINGNLTISAPSVFSIGRSVPYGVVVNGNLSGGTQIIIAGSPLTLIPYNFSIHGPNPT